MIERYPPLTPKVIGLQSQSLSHIYITTILQDWLLVTILNHFLRKARAGGGRGRRGDGEGWEEGEDGEGWEEREEDC